MKQLADAIPEGYLDGQSQMIDTVNLQEVHNSFMASSTHLFSFCDELSLPERGDTWREINLFLPIGVTVCRRTSLYGYL